MKVLSLLRTLRLLRGYLLRPRGPRRDVTESRVFPNGCRLPTIVYQPAAKARHTIVLLHGVTGLASDDPSLVHVARALAGLGYRCVTPALPRLADFYHDPCDIEAAVQGFSYALKLAQSPISVLAFSYGASFALSAAADPRVRHDLSGLVGFGAYFELAEVLEHQRQLLARYADPANDDADLAYLRYTLLACQREQVPLSKEAWQAIDPILVHFTSQRSIEQKREPLLRYASHIDFVQLMRDYQNSNLPQALSPNTILGDIRCPVGLCSDPEDRFVPRSHIEKLREALDRRPGVPKTRVLMTRMLSHVQVDPRKNFADLPKLVDLLDLILA